jgi:hypothetical protein
MALDFYAFHPPEDVPNYCEVEQMSDATLETFPRYYLEWIGVAMDHKAAEVEGTYRLVDAQVEVWEQCLPGLPPGWKRWGHSSAARQHEMATRDRARMRSLLQTIDRQRLRVQRRLWELAQAETHAAQDPAAPMTEQTLVATMSDLMYRFVVHRQDYLPFLHGLDTSLGIVLTRLFRQWAMILPDEVDAALDSVCRRLRPLTVEALCAAYQQQTPLLQPRAGPGRETSEDDTPC